MIHFKINFSHVERNYSALVQRVNGKSVEFHVCVIKEDGIIVDDPFVITAKAKEKMLEYYLPSDFSDLRFIIAKSIKAYCYENSINLFFQ